MSYEAALNKSWDEVTAIAPGHECPVGLLGDYYTVDIKNRRVISGSSKAPVKDFLIILLLHYLSGTLLKPFQPSGEWISFKDIEGGDFYYPAFREGAIKPILKKFASNPDKLAAVLKNLKGRVIEGGDAAVEISAFVDTVKCRIVIWAGDEEVGPDATILFDRKLPGIFSTEDIAVLLRFVAHKL